MERVTRGNSQAPTPKAQGPTPKERDAKALHEVRANQLRVASFHPAPPRTTRPWELVLWELGVGPWEWGVAFLGVDARAQRALP